MAANPGGRLNGNTPTIFDGDRTKSVDFIREFDLLWEMNTDHALFTEPYKRVMAALSYIRGPIVNDWVQDQITSNKAKVNRANNPLPRNSEILWTEFIDDFKAAYTNIAQKQHSYQKLHDLRMKGDRIDDFVARFKHLANEAGFPTGDPGTIDMFIKKFPISLLERILD